MPDLIAWVACKDGYEGVDGGTDYQDRHEKVDNDEDAHIQCAIWYEDPKVLLEDGDLDQTHAYSVDCACGIPPLEVIGVSRP